MLNINMNHIFYTNPSRNSMEDVILRRHGYPAARCQVLRAKVKVLAEPRRRSTVMFSGAAGEGNEV
jgi:hypothetical protein